MKDQKALAITGQNFDGLYSRGVTGNLYDPNECPSNGFTIANQVRYTPWGLQGRPGTQTFTLFSVFGVIVQILHYATNDSTTGASVIGYFVVEHTGGNTNVYDSNAAVPATPIDSIAGSYYLSIIVLYGRIAFTYHDYSLGALDYYQVYKPGQATSRDNGGVGPSLAGVNFASSGTAGIVTQGVHVFGLAYEYDTGHISVLSTISGADTGFFTLANANEQVTATGLPAAFPANVVKLHILASRLVVNPSGNSPDYELFFVHELTVAAVAATFNFSDESLVDSADYLYDIFDRLYCPLGFTYYAGRLITWGERYNSGDTVGPSCLRVSELQDPETFSKSHGVIPVFQDDGDTGVKSCWEYKGLLIIQKESRTFVTRDNGDEPNTWQVDVLDGTIGGVLFGIAKTSNQVGAIRTDYTISIGRNGVYVFDGKFNEIPLTWKIERLWQSISEQTQYLTYQIIDIPTAKLLIFKVWTDPIESFGAVPYMLVCDYSKGLTWQAVRWSRWFFTGVDPVWIAVQDRTTINFVENVSNVVDKMIIGSEHSEYNASFEDGLIRTGELNPDEELNLYHWVAIKIRGYFASIISCSWIFGSTFATINNPQTPSYEDDVSIIKMNQKNYFPQLQIQFGASGTGADQVFRLKQLVYFFSKAAEDILGS